MVTAREKQSMNNGGISTRYFVAALQANNQIRIPRRRFIQSAVASLGCAPAIHAKGRTPNILLLFADQHNAGAMSCAGHPQLKTPHLDALARAGVRFSRAYCQDGICVPSRTAMMTGKYPRTTGVIDNSDKPPLVRELLPLQRYLREQGYLTASIGKRHLKPGTAEDFDYSATTISPKQDPSDENYDDWIAKRGKADAWTRDHAGSLKVPMGCHISELGDDETGEAYTAQKTLDFLSRARKSGKPFFCWTSFLRPHQPYTPTATWARLYDPASVALPGNLREPADHLPPMMARWRANRNTPWSLALAAEDESLYRKYIAYYYGLVAEVDHHIGRIMDALRREGMAGDTIVLYTADHGDFVAGHGMIEKCALGHNVYEDTLRVPLIFSRPGQIREGQVCSGLAELIDLYPTLLDLAGLLRPSGYELAGRSLKSTLEQGAPTGHRAAISENWSQLTVITDRYKLGHWLEPPNPKYDYRRHGDQLFDLARDPLEVNNLAKRPEAGEIRAGLEKTANEWSARTPARAKELSAPRALGSGAAPKSR